MTYELQCETLCDHRVHRTNVSFPPFESYRILYIPEPISNDTDIRVWYNDIELKPNDPIFGWKIERDPNSAVEDMLRMIVFKRPIRDFFGVFEISYTVRSEKCRKCFGNLLVYDHALGSVGVGNAYTPLFNTFEMKLMQQITKILFTVAGSSPFEPWYGTSIPESMYQAIRDPAAIKRRLLTDVTLALDKIKNIHFHQSKIQYLHPREILEQVRNVDLKQDDTDPRVFYITVECTTLAGDNILIKRELLMGELFNNLPVRATGTN